MKLEVLRKAGPNETRCIIRHDLGHYTNLAVAVIYNIPTTSSDSGTRVQQPGFYAWALNECVAQHPFLATTIQNVNTNHPEYTRLSQLDLSNHIRVHQPSQFQSRDGSEGHGELDLLRRVFERIHNDAAFRFYSVESRPAWALDVVPLTTVGGVGCHRVFVSFTYSHSHGDGMSGMVFHKSFLRALQRSMRHDYTLNGLTVSCPTTTIPDQPDTPSNMPISLSYLLQPALATYLPTFLSRLLGIAGDPVTGADTGTWTGTQTFTDTATHGLKATTSVEITTIDSLTLTNVLKVCKTHNTKLTAFLDHAIGLSLQQILPDISSTRTQFTINFVSTIPINLRSILKVPQDTIGNYGGGAYLRHDLSQHSKDSTIPWTNLQCHGTHLSTVSSTLQNQSLGLLRFVTDFPSWINGQIGAARGCSWELSNLGSFEPSPGEPGSESETGTGIEDGVGVKVEQVLFSQPACSFGPPFTVNAVAVKGGELGVVISWQIGALGGEGEEEERGVVRKILGGVEEVFGRVAGML